MRLVNPRAAGLAALALTALACDRLVGIRPTVDRPGSGQAPRSDSGASPEGNAAQPDGSSRADGAGDGPRGEIAPPPAPRDGGTVDRTSDLANATVRDAPSVVVDARPPEDGASVRADGPPAAPPPCPAATVLGEIDVFQPSAEGNCSFPRDSLPEHVASVDTELYAEAAACGACLEVSGPRGKVVAQVVDHYVTRPGSMGHRISLNSAAMTRVSDVTSGVQYLRWRSVPCPAVGPINAALKAGSSEYAWQIIVRNFTNRIARFEFLTGDGTWREAKRESYNYYRQDSAMGLPPQLRLTDTSGTVRVTGRLTWPSDPRTMPISLDTQFPPACTP